ncbi:tRNA pseudouridine(38-40) synthase TruA [Methylophaga nitratireducenticrescens]|uniref:tRNA pseudouridine synthase A n=1 Tax=Methylophaga nitratireducenticrescens TaxID=754476 RepID=I1XKU2_METNJ|nr:tRNA pseudouridine(38-40) synthase TruA [Methylophaga nitratireducenticrescens]AFI85011.1 tRNA pseudouridine(38-40) synthase TruA [Methylophaga nitratireducenticrescens]
MRLALGVEYDGSQFHGWQFQPKQRTVQGELQKAVSLVANAQTEVFAAGRTDTGVHALNQVVHFDTEAVREERNWLLGLNSNLPHDVCVKWVNPVSEDFNARFSAIKRRYRYLILNRDSRSSVHHQRMWWVYKPLDEHKMQQAANSLLGQHDFSAFRAQECQAKSPIKTLDKLIVTRRDDCIAVDVEARSFLHHMVRNLMGVLVPIGEGKRPVDWAWQVLQSQNRNMAGVTAPPQGLYLTDVIYPDEFSLPTVSGFPVLW